METGPTFSRVDVLLLGFFFPLPFAPQNFPSFFRWEEDICLGVPRCFFSGPSLNRPAFRQGRSTSFSPPVPVLNFLRSPGSFRYALVLRRRKTFSALLSRRGFPTPPPVRFFGIARSGSFPQTPARFSLHLGFDEKYVHWFPPTAVSGIEFPFRCSNISLPARSSFTLFPFLVPFFCFSWCH